MSAMPTIQDRPVLEQLEEAIKWWNADEAEEPDVRRLFASCKARIEALEGALRDAAAKFREYEKLHLAKLKRDGTDALDFVKECERKARDNAGMAEMLEAALAGEPPVVQSPADQLSHIELSALDVNRIDLMVDEFRRIAALVPSGTEIAELCRRAIETTVQAVPVIAQRDEAEAQVRALRTRIAEDAEVIAQLSGSAPKMGVQGLALSLVRNNHCAACSENPNAICPRCDPRVVTSGVKLP